MKSKEKLKDIAHSIAHNKYITKDNYNNVDVILYMYQVIISNNIECEVKQGWIIDKNDNFKVKPILYIEVTDELGELFIVILDKIHICKDTRQLIYRKKPSQKIVNKQINREKQKLCS